MTSDLELEGEIFRLFLRIKKNNRSTPKQQNIENPRDRKPNFISKHKVMLHCSQICYLRYAKVYHLPATLAIGSKRFVIQIRLFSPHLLGGIWIFKIFQKPKICPIFKKSYHQKLPR